MKCKKKDILLIPIFVESKTQMKLVMKLGKTGKQQRIKRVSTQIGDGFAHLAKEVYYLSNDVGCGHRNYGEYWEEFGECGSEVGKLNWYKHA